MSVQQADRRYRVGQRVRYAGLTVLPVERGAEGRVAAVDAETMRPVVDFPGVPPQRCWPAELEAVAPPEPCAQCEHGKASHRLFEVERDPEPWSWCEQCGGLCEFVPPGGVLGGEAVAS